MKKLIIVSVTVIVAVMLLVGSCFVPAHARDSSKDEKSTFYRLTPGVYVNGWPRCTVRYPKEWVERLPMPQEIFRASAPGPDPFAAFVFAPFAPPTTPSLPHLDKLADTVSSFFKNVAQDVTIISDKPSRLRDGTPAREVEIRCLVNGVPHNVGGLAAHKGGLYINMGLESLSGKIGEDLKTILYSIEFQPDKDKPVKVPPDVQELLDRQCRDMVAHDFAKVKANYSNRYLSSGRTKGERERFYRQVFGSITSFQIVITDFMAAGEKAYLTGFATTNFGKVPLQDTSIIKEKGQWKWYGNQRNPVP
jgi:hypothetical protein